MNFHVRRTRNGRCGISFKSFFKSPFQYGLTLLKMETCLHFYPTFSGSQHSPYQLLIQVVYLLNMFVYCLTSLPPATLPLRRTSTEWGVFVTHAHFWILRAYNRAWIINTMHDVPITYHHSFNQSSSDGCLRLLPNFYSYNYTVVEYPWATTLAYLCTYIIE